MPRKLPCSSSKPMTVNRCPLIRTCLFNGSEFGNRASATLKPSTTTLAARCSSSLVKARPSAMFSPAVSKYEDVTPLSCTLSADLSWNLIAVLLLADAETADALGTSSRSLSAYSSRISRRFRYSHHLYSPPKPQGHFSTNTTFLPSISILSSKDLSMPSVMVFIAVTDTIPITIQVVVSRARTLFAQRAESAIFDPSVKLIKSFFINYQLGLKYDRITFMP